MDYIESKKKIDQAYREACLKHPEFPKGIFAQLSILAEEVGEVFKAANEQDIEGLKQELYQVGAMVLRVLMNLRE